MYCHMPDSVSESFAGIMKRVIFKHSECGHAILEVSFLLPQLANTDDHTVFTCAWKWLGQREASYLIQNLFML